MRQNDILNRIRCILGLPLAFAACGGAEDGEFGLHPHMAEDEFLSEPLVEIQVSSLLGGEAEPVATYLSVSERTVVVEKCLERFLECSDNCNLGAIGIIQDADFVAQKQLVALRTTFHTSGWPAQCADPKWTFERYYFYSETGELANGQPPYGSKLYYATGDGRTGEIRSMGLMGTQQYDPLSRTGVVPGRPFHGHTAKVSSGVHNRWVRAAQYEHASVASFARHLVEMMSLGAPIDLLQAITKAQQDELRHTEMCLGRAAQDGVEVTLDCLDVEVPIRRSAYEIGCGVALEGCVNETLAVLRLVEELPDASDDDAELLMSIAQDEIEHAELAWRTLLWLWPKLSSNEQTSVRRGMRRAIPSRYRSALRPMVRALAV